MPDKLMRKAVFFVPLTLFLLSGLFSNPRERGSAIVGKPLPAFSLPDLMSPQKLWQPEALRGKAYLLNVWGTWCPTCNAELGYLAELRAQGVNIIGLYYELPRDPAFDPPFDLATLQQDVRQKLTQQGDPYLFNILDQHRTLSLDLGVSGAPETFLIDQNGIVRAHHIGDINPQVWRSTLAPLYQQWSQP